MNDLMKDLGAMHQGSEATDAPKQSPGRSDAGNLRNYGQMGASKLTALWEKVLELGRDHDPEVYDGVEAAMREKDLL